MNFLEAIESAKEGKQVTRASWGDGNILEWHNKQKNREGLHLISEGKKGKLFNVIPLNWITAKDWEEVK